MRLRTFGGLWLELPDGAREVRARPRPLALLAVLATADAKGLTRDSVVGVLWPDTDEDRARHALSQTLYLVRREVGADVIRADGTLRLEPGRITSDVADFRAAVAAKRWFDAAALYTGRFLDGFYLNDAPGFERWVECERAALETDGIRAIEAAAKASTAAGHHDQAAELFRRLTRIDPISPRIATACMEALATAGDESAALAHGRAYAEFVRRELDGEPDPSVAVLMARLGARASDVPAAPTPSAPARIERGPAASTRPRVRSPIWLVRRPVGIAAAIASLAAALVGLRAATASPAPTLPVLAVGSVRDLTGTDSLTLGSVSSDMLATSLGRVDGLQVVASSRMVELTSGAREASPVALTDAARRAGATEILDGELLPTAEGMRLDVRRIDLTRGLVRRVYRITGTERIALLDSVTTLIAADLHVAAPTGSVAQVSTRSPLASWYYQEGLRAIYQADRKTADRMFRSAIQADSTFPMATYYAWVMAKNLSRPDAERLADRAVALAQHASAHDRLLILAHIGADRFDPRALAVAETLATRYPMDPDAMVSAGFIVPDLSDAVRFLDRAIAMDSAARLDSAAVCRICNALAVLTNRYAWADSGAAVERTIARWSRFRPNDPAPSKYLGEWLVGQGRRADAEAALRHYDALGGSDGDAHLMALVQAIRLDDMDSANRECTDGLSTRDGDVYLRYRWYCTIALRTQGRYREAIALARDNVAPPPAVVRHRPGPEVYQTALLDMELGRGRVAATEFRAIDRDRGDTAVATASRRAHDMAWILTLSVTASAAAGDTARVRLLVDTIATLGRQSIFPRDQRLHHFVRGLLVAAARRDDDALSEFQAAMSSPTFGYTRINYEIGRRLLALGRPADGVAPVRAALRGGIEGSGLYVTRTELHELLAQLFAAAGQADSAAAHYAVVDRVWRDADPRFATRRALAHSRIPIEAHSARSRDTDGS